MPDTGGEEGKKNVTGSPDDAVSKALEAMQAVPEHARAEVAKAAVKAVPENAKAGVAKAAVEAVPEDATAGVAKAAVDAVPEDATADVAKAAVDAVPGSAQAEVATAAARGLTAEDQDELAQSLAPPDQAVTNEIWRWIVKTFAVVLVVATIALVTAVFISFWRDEVEPEFVQILLTVFTTVAGILAGFVSGRASAGRVGRR